MSLHTPPLPNTAFDLLADRERRSILRILRARGAIGERALARHVASRCHDTPPESVSGTSAAVSDGARDEDSTVHAADESTQPVDEERVEAVRISLWHVHLPMLDETALVAHDREERRVEPGPALDSVEPLLAYAADHGSDEPLA